MHKHQIWLGWHNNCCPVLQNDRVFTFRFNVMVTTAHGHWTNRPVSAVCSGSTLSDREIICEEDYMEVGTCFSAQTN